MFFELLLFVLFIVVPVVNRLRRGSQNQSQRPGQGQATQGQTGQGQAGQGQGQNRQGQATSNRSQSSPNEAFRKRLEEARQRVLEAERANQQGSQSQQGQSRQQGQPRQSTQANAPTRPPLIPVETAKSDRQPVDRPVLAQKDDKRIEGYGVSLEKSTNALRKTNRPPKVAQPRAAKKLDKTLLVKRKRHKRVFLNTDKPSLIQGIIWREVFNDPVSKRPKRNTPRRTTSPQRPRP
jgi:hypothetical protein